MSTTTYVYDSTMQRVAVCLVKPEDSVDISGLTGYYKLYIYLIWIE